MSLIRRCGPVAVGSMGMLSWPATVSAHHMMGGRLPASWLEGFVSGLGHPVIGLDHLLAVIALGMLSSRLPKGTLVVGPFLLAALAGTGIHVLRLDLPAAEIVVSASVVGLGALLLVGWQGHLGTLTALAFGAGMFHGYAYGEFIVGAETTPLAAYLIGFTLAQFAVAMGGRAFAQAIAAQPVRSLWVARALGTTVSLCGVLFLVKAIGV